MPRRLAMATVCPALLTAALLPVVASAGEGAKGAAQKFVVHEWGVYTRQRSAGAPGTKMNVGASRADPGSGATAFWGEARQRLNVGGPLGTAGRPVPGARGRKTRP
jgi:hypothetical protein